MDMIGMGRETTVNGTTLAWCELGSGPPLVLLHGIHDSHRSWRRVAPMLAQWFHVVMPDLPGHGLSSRPDAPYTLTWYAQTISAWMGTIGVTKAHVCGHSLGGGIGQWMVLEQRHRIDRLALVSPGGFGREVGMGLKYAALPIVGPRLTPWVVRVGFPMLRWLKPRTFGYMESEEADRVVESGRVPGTDRAFRRSLESVINVRGQYVRTFDRVHEIETLPPIALFWGEKDPILPVKHGRAAVAGATGISLKTYLPTLRALSTARNPCDPGAGHQRVPLRSRPNGASHPAWSQAAKPGRRSPLRDRSHQDDTAVHQIDAGPKRCGTGCPAGASAALPRLARACVDCGIE